MTDPIVGFRMCHFEIMELSKAVILFLLLLDTSVSFIISHKMETVPGKKPLNNKSFLPAKTANLAGAIILRLPH